MSTKLVWIPKHSLNSILFDQPFPDVLGFLNTHRITGLGEYSEGTLSVAFDFQVWFYIDVEGIFRGAEVWTNLWLNNVNLVGMNVDELKHLFPNNGFIFDENQNMYKSDLLSALFWVEEEVVTAITVYA